ncbi:flavin-binding monooxygenase-like protein [Ophiostoma piceae UAMH 11346]|uniref:Flavin-binding monooxygenase-like protein n=1 Tax=Ophiostoma piceae (strain UAMH 11346) TaxID=1262450 RepID=S3C967_OPHP1|nr:flavin-binding monooxygenase-like protein [Ophiostoma piceae UAMH 11346]
MPESYSLNPVTLGFQLWQDALDKFLSPNPPDPNIKLGRPKVAIVGAGITGITSAAHCVGHGFDVVLFEAGGSDHLGGIWSQVNDTSGLQINSAMYRFHPSVKWSRGYPSRAEIIEQVTKLWERYSLESKTQFNTSVDKVYQDDKGRWIVNNPSNGRFEGVIAAIGTCGEPKLPHIEGMERFKGDIFHSSELTGKSAKGKRIAIIGGGASAVEALEFADKTDASMTYVLARSEKWIIPRNLLVDILLSFNIFGQETLLSWIPESLLRNFFYGQDLKHIAPPKNQGLFMDTPMVNSDVIQKLRDGKAEWVRCDIEKITDTGVVVNRRGQGVPKGGPGHREEIDVDMVVLATGFKRPPLSFLPKDCFGEPYEPPNWYLQTFPPNHPSISAINCTYLSAIGTVGNWHIGIYTRILLMFLVDPLTRPSPFWMERWIDMTRFLKHWSPTKAFDFFTYLELIWWFSFCVVINPFRWKWAVFVFFGIGIGLPKATIEIESDIRDKMGLKDESGGGRDVGNSF